MLRARWSGLALGVCAALVAAESVTQAASVTFNAVPFTGDPIDVQVTLDDVAGGAGNVQFTVEVVNAPPTGDLRGFWFDIDDDALVSGLSVSGADITSSTFNANSVNNLGGGVNLNGAGTPAPLDAGLVIGTNGTNADDIQSTMFVISHSTDSLSLANFLGQEVGVRVQSVGDRSGRGGSSKLKGTVPVPVPAAAWMGLVVLGGMGVVRKIRNR